MHSKIYALFLFVWMLSFGSAFAQNTAVQNPWVFSAEPTLRLNEERLIIPTSYQTATLNTDALQVMLRDAPMEGEAGELILPVPMPDGSFEEFYIEQYLMMEAPLQAAHPDITTYIGRSVNDPSMQIRMDYTLQGFHAMIKTAETILYIDPYSTRNLNNYLVYDKNDLEATEEFTCHVQEDLTGAVPSQSQHQRAGDCVFRSYRLAVSVTGDYSNFFGATDASNSSLVLSAVTTAINRVNEVYENDLSIRFVLIADIEDLFYYDGNTDPYTNGNSSAALGEVQGAIDALIPSSAYDIGHLFMYSGGGLANLQVPCNDSNKARGVTGVFNLASDHFYISYVAHEIGHQFGATHTQNNSCQRTASTAMEPGSGSTIMGYAGICSPNIQNTSDDYFHATSIDQILDFVVNGNGNSCDTPISSSNNAPTVSPVANYTIPVSTPFVLTAVASDMDSDPMTYCWEQMDNGFGTHPPASTATDSPVFRTYQPTTDPARYFPRLSDLITNTDYDWEELPSVSRDLNFRCTVRDNNSLNGCTAETDMIVTTDAGSGPFVVSAPNTAATYQVGGCLDVAWDVANTNLAPVNAAAVDIFLSTDGGMTYPITLATGVPNDGFVSVLTPNNATTQGRVMVKGANNIFFDISDADFTIQSGTADYDLCRSEDAVVACSGQNAVITIDIPSIMGFTGNVALATSNLPSGTTASFSNNPVAAGGQTVVTISNTAGVPSGVYPINIDASASSGSKTVSFDLLLSDGADQPILTDPADAATDITFKPTLTWAPDALTNSFEVEMASDAAFTNIIYSGTTSANSADILTELEPSTTYHWRVRGTNDCGVGTFSPTNTFTTHGCVTYDATDLPILLPFTGSGTYTSTISIPDNGTIEDINVVGLSGEHERMKNIDFRLRNAAGTSITLMPRPNCLNVGFDFSFDDEAALDYTSIPCPANSGLAYSPQIALSTFDGQSMNGDWYLDIKDYGAAAFGGEFQAWSLEVCPLNFQGLVLPVELLEFVARPRRDHIQLNWSTAFEQNNRGFELQRRAEGNTEFEKIAWIDGHGTTETTQEYTYSDRTARPGVRYYYRLLQTDQNGSVEISHLVSAQLGLTGLAAQIYPNPVRDDLTITVDTDEFPLTVELIDISGRNLTSFELLERQGRVDMSAYPQGVYTVKIRSNAGWIIQKIVKN